MYPVEAAMYEVRGMMGWRWYVKSPIERMIPPYLDHPDSRSTATLMPPNDESGALEMKDALCYGLEERVAVTAHSMRHRPLDPRVSFPDLEANLGG